MKKSILDANQAAGKISYKLSEVIPIYPITPSTPMAETASHLSSEKEKNIFGEDVNVFEMQSEGGVAGAMHGALISGGLSSTFTCSQGLLLMIPNMYKMVGEELPAVIHVACRTISSHALSIFCDHSDVYATRQTGFVMISSSSVQDAHDMAILAHLLAVKHNTPVLHFFDGFRTSHEIEKIDEITDEELKSIFPKLDDISIKHNHLTPDNPKIYGTAQNPDVFYQNKEVKNGKYAAFSQKFYEEAKILSKITKRDYKPFEYFGCESAEEVIVAMGSSICTIKETLTSLKSNTGLINVRLYRPFDEEEFLKSLPKSVKKICVLDRTHEYGGKNPLYLDVSAAVLKSGRKIKVIAGRYGLGGKEFSPRCVKAVIDNLSLKNPKDDFNVGIVDDLTNSSLNLEDYQNNLNQTQIKIFGLGSDGSVSASKSITRILGKQKTGYVQGFFEYDSKKAGSLTTSHIRISNEEILSSYLISRPNIVLINNFSFVHKYDCLSGLKPNGIVLINSIFNKDEIDKVLPNSYKQILKETRSKLYVINAQKIAKMLGLGDKINVIMEAGLFKAAKLLPTKQIYDILASDITKIFAKKGKACLDKNLKAISEGLNDLEEVDVNKLTFKEENHEEKSYPFSNIMEKVKALKGDQLKVSDFSSNGAYPTDTAKHEKRAIAKEIPIWLPENCIECGMCVLACPHGAIRAVLADENESVEDVEFKDAIGLKGKKYRIVISPEDCTGCGVCASTCPAIKKALKMTLASKALDEQKAIYARLLNLKSQKAFNDDYPKGLQFNPSYFSFPGACAGCGETPYIKLASMLFGQKMIIANATGCSSIYCGSFPSCPFNKNEENKGPAWASSLFEDNAEFGLGIKLGSKFTEGEKSVWIIGGDGWATDIGFAGLDHVLCSNENVNILVLDNETYSNTGGQASKSTPAGARAKFAENGKKTKKKNLGLLAMSYQNAYVAQVSLGADMAQCIKAFKEAEKFDGPSIIIAYSPCVEHGFDMSETMKEMKKAVDSGYFNLFRYNPKEFGLVIDSDVKIKPEEFLKGESRYQDSGKDLIKKNISDSQNLLKILKMLENK